jgi:hypothetical protein
MRTVHRHAASRRIEVLLARAQVSVLAAHAHAARSLVHTLRDRLPAHDVLSIYCARQKLPPGEARYVGLHALARLPLPHEEEDPAADSELSEHARADADGWLSRGFRFIRDQVAPLADPEIRAHVETELAQATTSLMVLHVRHALRFAAAIGDSVPAHAAVAMYLDELDVASELRAAVYALAVAQVSGHRTALPPGANLLAESKGNHSDATASSHLTAAAR